MKRMHIVIPTTLLLLALALPAMAQPGGGRRGPDGFLNSLPPEKQQVIKAIVDQQRASHFELRQQMRVKMIQLKALVVDPKADQARIDALADEISAMRAKMFKDGVATQRKIYLETGVIMPTGKGGPGYHGRGPGRGGKGGPA